MRGPLATEPSVGIAGAEELHLGAPSYPPTAHAQHYPRSSQQRGTKNQSRKVQGVREVGGGGDRGKQQGAGGAVMPSAEHERSSYGA